ncbi:hypothetical protein PJP13_20800, partial [Mycobacterium kansasii]
AVEEPDVWVVSATRRPALRAVEEPDVWVVSATRRPALRAVEEPDGPANYLGHQPVTTAPSRDAPGSGSRVPIGLRP